MLKTVRCHISPTSQGKCVFISLQTMMYLRWEKQTPIILVIQMLFITSESQIIEISEPEEGQFSHNQVIIIKNPSACLLIECFDSVLHFVS